ncbi:hypothetical protein LOD99_4328 [Oopsacas minuta]|uniref:DED domain-containing protein n=1 Tax=Oopsacas minuta TaxID=111878 RepID=A0AAV7JU71_9METZ|nr:hypothetical protein LOD99_4328 [Oopsacas minuta]
MASYLPIEDPKLGTVYGSIFAMHRGMILKILSENLTTDLIQKIRFLNGLEVENTLKESTIEATIKFIRHLSNRKLLSLSHLISQLESLEQINLAGKLEEICKKLDIQDLERDREYARGELMEILESKSTGYLLKDPEARIAVVKTFEGESTNCEDYFVFKDSFSTQLSPAEFENCNSTIKLVQLLDSHRALRWKLFIEILESSCYRRYAKHLKKYLTEFGIDFEKSTDIHLYKIDGSDVTIKTFSIPSLDRLANKPWKDAKYSQIGCYRDGKALEHIRADLIKVISEEVLYPLNSVLCFTYQIPSKDKQQSSTLLEDLSNRCELCITLLIEILYYLEAVSIANRIQTIYEKLPIDIQELDKEFCDLVKLKISNKRGKAFKLLRNRICFARAFQSLSKEAVVRFGSCYAELNPPRYPPNKVEDLQDIFTLLLYLDASNCEINLVEEFKQVLEELDELGVSTIDKRKFYSTAKNLNCTFY